MRISDWSSDVCSSDLKKWEYGRKRKGGSRTNIEKKKTKNYNMMRAKALSKQRRSAKDKHTVMKRHLRSEERRVGKECAVRVDLGGRRIIKNKTNITVQ